MLLRQNSPVGSEIHISHHIFTAEMFRVNHIYLLSKRCILYWHWFQVCNGLQRDSRV